MLSTQPTAVVTSTRRPAMPQPDLKHAYGPASDIPALLHAARTAPAPHAYTAEPWFSLWSALYHRDDIYSASYAAVPELVRIAEIRPDRAGAEALYLAALIELRRHEPGAPAMPDDIRVSYEAAVQAARSPAETALAEDRNPEESQLLEIAAAVFRGQHELARELLEQDA